MNSNLGIRDIYSAPYSLICAYNYPALFEVVSGVGYSITVPRDQEYIRTHPVFSSGIYASSQQADVLKERPQCALRHAGECESVAHHAEHAGRCAD